ncbi:Uncharacterised protein [Vibrio metschnikovii]|nr:Uncharacterised protein [Vibrio metschnikovii]
MVFAEGSIEEGAVQINNHSMPLPKNADVQSLYCVSHGCQEKK